MSKYRYCARCRRDITCATETGISSIYNPRGPEYILCGPCFFEEDTLIEKSGTNNLPEVIEKYKTNIMLMRKLIRRN